MAQRFRAQCVAVGRGLPERRVGNSELESLVETSDAWIVSRTGIRERRLVDPGTRLSDLATMAARDCLERAEVAASEIDGIVCATCTGDHTMPATANLLQARLGAGRAWGFDVLNACNGFLAGLAAGACWIECGRARRILVVGGDLMSTVIDWRDRNTCILFGDGCGAVLLEAGPADGPGLTALHLASDGSGGPLLEIPASGSAMPVDAAAIARGDHYLKQQGRAVFTHAVRRMYESCAAVLGDLGLTTADIDLLVPHQANLRIIEAVAERLDLPMERVVVNIDRLGNTTAGTVPLALADAEDSGRLVAGSRVLITTFGAGFAWGAAHCIWGRG